MNERLCALINQELFYEYYGASASETRKKFAQGIDFTNLPDLPLLLLPPHNRLRNIVDHGFMQHDRIPKPIFECSSYELLFNMCEEGNGITFLSELTLFPPQGKRDLSKVLIFPIKGSHISTDFFSRISEKEPHYVQVFKEECRRIFSQQQDQMALNWQNYLSASCSG